jgi:cell wall-associated NlpC family hydrolase
MSWMESGYLIWRDASILPDYPLQPVDRERLKEADLIFFPGHVAVYIGSGRYVHATAWRKTPRVTINSLNPDDPDYRRDLAESISAFGSLFRS